MVRNCFQPAHCNKREFDLDVRRNSRYDLKATASEYTGRKTISFSFICILVHPHFSGTPQLHSLFEYKTPGGSSQHQLFSPFVTYLSIYLTRQHKIYSLIRLKPVKTPIRMLTPKQKHYVDMSNILGDLWKMYLTT